MKRLFDYDDWGNREELARLRTAPNDRARRIFAHIIGTEWLWLARLRGEQAPMAVWPELTLDDCARQLDALHDAWRELWQSPPTGSIAYVNSKGESWTSDVDDVLMHVILHGSYHRGQIAMALRDAGEEPAYTDFIHAARQGFLS